MQAEFDSRSQLDVVGGLNVATIRFRHDRQQPELSKARRASEQGRRGVTCRLNSDQTHNIALSPLVSRILRALDTIFVMEGLLSLPLELLVLISSFVSTADLAALRLTCKQVEKSLWEWFTEEFFVKKQFMITQPSLQALLDISRHVSLSKKLKHLIIATTIYDDVPVRFRDSDACFRFVHTRVNMLCSS